MDRIYEVVKGKTIRKSAINTLSRSEFIECLLRMAMKKYGNLTKNPSEAIERFLANDFVKNVRSAERKYLEVRSNQIHTREVSDKLKEYEHVLNELLNQLQGVGLPPQTAALHKVIEYFQKLTTSSNRFEIMKCFAYSKELLIPADIDYQGSFFCASTTTSYLVFPRFL